MAKLFLDRHVKLKKGQKALHFAPEAQLGKYLDDVLRDGCTAADIDPARYTGKTRRPVMKFDLCTDTQDLPDNTYDLVIHNHVMAHVPCNVTRVLQHLHRAVKPGGVHLFSVPVMAGYFAEDLNPALTETERNTQFGQRDHVRRFGRADFGATLGAVFGLKDTYNLRDFFSDEELHTAKVRQSHWVCSGSSVFYLRK